MLTEMQAYQAADQTCTRLLRQAVLNPELDGWAAYEEACEARRMTLVAVLDKQTHDILFAQGSADLEGGSVGPHS